jgi:hypothetical protein
VEQGVPQMLGIAGGAERRDRQRFRDPFRRREHRAAAQAVADQQPRRLALATQEVRRRYQVVEVGVEIRGGEISSALADAGEVEP